MGCGAARPYRCNAVEQKHHFAHMAALVLKVVLFLGPETLGALPQHHDLDGPMPAQPRSQ